MRREVCAVVGGEHVWVGFEVAVSVVVALVQVERGLGMKELLVLVLGAAVVCVIF